jgi:hypothetical protein
MSEPESKHIAECDIDKFILSAKKNTKFKPFMSLAKSHSSMASMAQID